MTSGNSPGRHNSLAVPDRFAALAMTRDGWADVPDRFAARAMTRGGKKSLLP